MLLFVFGFLFLFFYDIYIYIYIRLCHGLGPEVAGWMGPAGPVETRRAGFGAKKKTCLLNGPGLGNKGRPVGRVRVSKNPART